jgi:hypothetical protein
MPDDTFDPGQMDLCEDCDQRFVTRDRRDDPGWAGCHIDLAFIAQDECMAPEHCAPWRERQAGS